MNNQSRIGEYIKNKAKQKVNKFMRGLLSKLLPYIVPLVTIIFIIMILLSTVQGFVATGTIDDTLTPEQNSSIKAEFINKVEETNKKNTFDISGRRIGSLVDYYGTDDDLKLNWAYVQTYIKYREISNDEDYNDKNTTDNIDRVTKEIDIALEELKPKFVYKTDKITTVHEYIDEETYIDQDGNERKRKVHKSDTTEKQIYLLTNAETIKGTYSVTYRNEKTVSGSPDDKYTVTTPVIDQFNQEGSDYDNLKAIILKNNPNENIDLALDFIINTAQNYQNQSDNMDWVFADITGFGGGGLIDSSVIPSNLLPYFKNAEKKYGIPWWFSGAIAYKESSFNVNAENVTSKCYGLMQLSPDNWSRLSKLLGYDSIKDKDNPEAQIMAGVYLLKSFMGDIQWTSNNWKELTLPALTLYSGYGKNESACRENYANKVWEYADTFKNQSELAYNPRWPVIGYTGITSPFGQRIDPFNSSIVKMHTGVDIGAPHGAKVVAAIDGTVTWAKTRSTYGNLVIIEGANGIETRYAHLNSFNVKEGQKVRIGDYIATVDSTGASTGNHLHFEVRINGTPVDPIKWLTQQK